MEEIEVGDYVRTINGLIRKVKTIYGEEDRKQRTISLKKETLINGNINIFDIVKHSKNITDLIEVGDYVNGSKLISIDYAEDKEGNCDKLHYYYQFEDDEKDINEYYETLKIKSIVTKEQFANMEYRLEEKWKKI